MIRVAQLRAHLLTLYRSTTVRATLVFGGSGVASMLGSLLLARVLSELDFAAVALFLAFGQIGTTLGMAGAETLIVRHGLSPTWRLLGTLLGFSSLVGVLLLVVGMAGYGMSLALAVITAVAVVASAVTRAEAAFYQKRQHFRVALLILQSNTFVLLAVGLGAVSLGMEGAVVPCILITVGYVIIAAWCWRAADKAHGEPKPQGGPYPWKEAWPIIGYGTAGVLSVQAERLLIPQLLTFELLATYTVLAALAAAPFQMLMVGVGYTMLPRLKNSQSQQHRRKIVRNELLIVSLVSFVGALLVLALAPFLARVLTAGMYELTNTMVAATVFAGLGKVAYGFVSAVLRAIGTTRHLHVLNVTSWLGLTFVVLAAIPGARFGLEGILVAVGLSWFARTAILVPATFAVLREPAPAA